jgi:hypothetical protein
VTVALGLRRALVRAGQLLQISTACAVGLESGHIRIPTPHIEIMIGLSDPRLVHFGRANLGHVSRALKANVVCESEACVTRTYDPSANHCSSLNAPNGTACETSCVVDGRCKDGVCAGADRHCDDGLACTYNSCDEGIGCISTPEDDACPEPSSPCQVRVCNPGTGCGVVPILDGTPCGPEGCSTARTCAAGACVTTEKETVDCELPERLMGASGFVCGITPSHQVKCWGRLMWIGVPQYSSYVFKVPTEVDTPPFLDVTPVDANGLCIIDLAREVQCWGVSHPALSSPLPKKVGGLSDVVQITSGLDTACALQADGVVKCWGDNRRGGLGNPAYVFSDEPVEVAGLPAVDELSGGGLSYCARSGDEVWCWGQRGGLCDGSNEDRPSPVLSCVSDVRQLHRATFGSAQFAETQDGRLYGWGSNVDTAIGIGPTVILGPPVEIPLHDVAHVESKYFSTCALTIYGEVYCWGDACRGGIGDGQLKCGIEREVPFPVRVPGLGHVTSLTKVHHAACALQQDGKVFCWGPNYDGQAGDGTNEMRPSPVRVLW